MTSATRAVVAFSIFIVVLTGIGVTLLVKARQAEVDRIASKVVQITSYGGGSRP